MSEHHGSCQEPSRGVCHALSGNVLGHVACALLEDCDALTHIHSRKQPWATNQASHLRSQQMYLRICGVCSLPGGSVGPTPTISAFLSLLCDTAWERWPHCCDLKGNALLMHEVKVQNVDR